VSCQDKPGTVYVSPAGNLWLCLDPGDFHAGRFARMLSLETGEERLMYRDTHDLVRYGWRRWEGER
jgi:hypothetical protein